MRKPWYIWLSLLGFMYLYLLIILRTLRGSLRHEKGTLDRWIWAVGVLFGLMICLMLPTWLLSIALHQTMFEGLILVYFYFAGVFVTYQLYKWKKKHFD